MIKLKMLLEMAKMVAMVEWILKSMWICLDEAYGAILGHPNDDDGWRWLITSVDCGYLVHRSVACGSSVESILTVKQTSASTRVNRFTIQYRLLIREYTVRSSFDFLTIYTSKNAHVTTRACFVRFVFALFRGRQHLHRKSTISRTRRKGKQGVVVAGEGPAEADRDTHRWFCKKDRSLVS